MPVLEAKKDEAVGQSTCCPEYKMRYSAPCNAAYCENCDTWYGTPVVKATALGPTWARDKATGRFIMPRYTLGREIARWAQKWLRNPDGTPWRYTKEQLRLLYWIYAVDERGRWIYRELNIQRLKGWG